MHGSAPWSPAPADDRTTVLTPSTCSVIGLEQSPSELRCYVAFFTIVLSGCEGIRVREHAQVCFGAGSWRLTNAGMSRCSLSVIDSDARANRWVLRRPNLRRLSGSPSDPSRTTRPIGLSRISSRFGRGRATVPCACHGSPGATRRYRRPQRRTGGGLARGSDSRRRYVCASTTWRSWLVQRARRPPTEAEGRALPL